MTTGKGCRAMAEGRIILRSLGSSRKFAALPGVAGSLAEFAQALYPLLITNTDTWGRLPGDAFGVKFSVWPTSPRTEAEFDAALHALAVVHLIDRYVVGGQQVIQILRFDEGQPGLRFDRRGKQSRFPAPLDSPNPSTPIPDTPGPSGTLPVTPSEEKRREEKGREEEHVEVVVPPLPATPHTTAVVGVGDTPKRRRRKAVPRDTPAGFDAFWREYPKPRDRGDAELAWLEMAITEEMLATVLLPALREQREWPEWREDGGKWIPWPAKWLRKKRWLDRRGAGGDGLSKGARSTMEAGKRNLERHGIVPGNDIPF